MITMLAGICVGIILGVVSCMIFSILSAKNAEGVISTSRYSYCCSDHSEILNSIYKFFELNRDKVVLVDLDESRNFGGVGYIHIWYKNLTNENVKLPF